MHAEEEEEEREEVTTHRVDIWPEARVALPLSLPVSFALFLGMGGGGGDASVAAVAATAALINKKVNVIIIIIAVDVVGLIIFGQLCKVNNLIFRSFAR